MAKHQRDPAKEAFWREAINRFAASGLSVRAYCQRERLTESAFYAWRRTLGERDNAVRSRPAFVPVVVAAASSKESSLSNEPSIAIELAGGCFVRLSGPNAIERLADLAIALQARGAR